MGEKDLETSCDKLCSESNISSNYLSYHLQNALLGVSRKVSQKNTPATIVEGVFLVNNRTGGVGQTGHISTESNPLLIVCG